METQDVVKKLRKIADELDGWWLPDYYSRSHPDDPFRKLMTFLRNSYQDIRGDLLGVKEIIDLSLESTGQDLELAAKIGRILEIDIGLLGLVKKVREVLQIGVEDTLSVCANERIAGLITELERDLPRMAGKMRRLADALEKWEVSHASTE